MVKRAIEWLYRDTDWLLGERSFSQEELMSGLEISAEQVQMLLGELARRQVGRVDHRQGEGRLVRDRLLL